MSKLNIAVADESETSPAEDKWTKVKAIIRKTTRRDVLSHEEIRSRLFGNPGFPNHTGIRGYNKFQLSVGQPHHCVGTLRLAELLTMWGVDAMQWLRGEARGVAHDPEPVTLP